MKFKFNHRNFRYLAVLVAILLFTISACRKEMFTISTTDDVNITGYLEKNPEEFSLFLQILDRSGTRGYLGAYGTYTLFTPNNSAVTAWLKDLNKSSVEQLSAAELKDVVRFHLLVDTVATDKFTDGKIRQITEYGQYLLSGVVSRNGVSSYIINKEALILKTNVRVGNGIIHVLDRVLTPATKTLATLIEENPRYSMFTAALKETGFFDSLNFAQANVPNPSRRFQTVILESDSALRAAGFSNYAALKARLSRTGNPRNQLDSLWMYVAYHIVPEPSYTADIVTTPTLVTLAPSEIITTKLVGTTILLNENEFNGVIEPGVEINRPFSDITAANGVIHESKSFFRVRPRQPTAVFFDIGDQPELRRISGWRVPGAASIPLIQNGALITSGIRGDKIPTTPQNYVVPSLAIDGAGRSYANRDHFRFSAAPNNPPRFAWVEFRTPMIVKGRYRVWICYAQVGRTTIAQVGMNVGTPQEQFLPDLVNFRSTLSASGVTTANAGLPSADPLMLTNGFKRYMATTADINNGVRGLQPVNTSGWDLMVGRTAGVVDIKTTDRHWLRLSIVSGENQSETMMIDMIHFIPVDQDQNYPRFSPSGLIYQRP